MRRALLACVLMTCLPLAGAGAVQSPEAARILAGMRQALGGDVLANVQAFSVRGTEIEHIKNRTLKTDVEWIYAAPDRFIKVSSITGFLVGFRLTTGFSGDVFIWGPGGPGGEA